MKKTLMVAAIAGAAGLGFISKTEASQEDIPIEIESVIADYRSATRKCGLLTDAPYDKRSCDKADQLFKTLSQNNICVQPDAQRRSPADLIFARCNSTQKVNIDPRSCAPRGDVFAMVAAIRDRGQSPESALQSASQYLNKGIPDLDIHFIKVAINTVYFEPAYTNASGQLLAKQVQQLCLAASKPKYQPLK